MKRLRHPIRAIREPFGTVGLIVAMVALVAALGGTALAAKGALTSKQKKEVEKIAKKFAGKPGAQGPAGANGTNGANGKDGANGTNGSNGESVTIAAASGGECSNGGTKFSNKTGSGHVCNGKDGETGFTETLPEGKTEAGVWSFGVGSLGFVVTGTPISYNIPLSAALATNKIHYIDENGLEQPAGLASTTCHGTASAPSADAGNLCVYASNENEMWFPVASVEHYEPVAGYPSSFSTGAVLGLFSEAEGSGFAIGTWAVTAPTSP